MKKIEYVDSLPYRKESKAEKKWRSEQLEALWDGLQEIPCVSCGHPDKRWFDAPWPFGGWFLGNEDGSKLYRFRVVCSECGLYVFVRMHKEEPDFLDFVLAELQIKHYGKVMEALEGNG